MDKRIVWCVCLLCACCAGFASAQIRKAPAPFDAEKKIAALEERIKWLEIEFSTFKIATERRLERNGIGH